MQIFWKVRVKAPVENDGMSLKKLPQTSEKTAAGFDQNCRWFSVKLPQVSTKTSGSFFSGVVCRSFNRMDVPEKGNQKAIKWDNYLMIRTTILIKRIFVQTLATYLYR